MKDIMGVKGTTLLGTIAIVLLAMGGSIAMGLKSREYRTQLECEEDRTIVTAYEWCAANYPQCKLTYKDHADYTKAYERAYNQHCEFLGELPTGP